MSSGYKLRRVKLKRHDRGSDRHNKGIAYEAKRARLAQDHERQRSNRRRKPL